MDTKIIYPNYTFHHSDKHAGVQTYVRFKYRGVWYLNAVCGHAERSSSLTDSEWERTKELLLKEFILDCCLFQTLQTHNAKSIKLLGIKKDFYQHSERERLIRDYRKGIL